MRGPTGGSIVGDGPCNAAGLGAGPFVAGSTAAAFSPTDISGLILWAKNESIATGVNATWADSSGQANTLTGVASPVGAADAQYGAYKSIAFNGTTQYFFTSTAISFGPSTIFMVARLTSAGYIFHRGTVNQDYLYGDLGASVSMARASVVSSYNLTANWALGAVPRTLVVSSDGTHAGHTLGINGAAQSLSTLTGNAPGTGAVAAALAFMASDGGAVLSTGTVGEILVYNSALSGANVISVQNYLRTKFGHY